MFNVDLKNVMVSDIGRGPCFSKSDDERARRNGFYQTEMIYALLWGEFPDCEACWAWPAGSLSILQFSAETTVPQGGISWGQQRPWEEGLPFKVQAFSTLHFCYNIYCAVLLLCWVFSSPDHSLRRGNDLADLFQCPGLSVPSTVPMGALDKTLLNE